MYQRYLTQVECDAIIAGYMDDRPPHCNPTTLHEPKSCAFCDGYYQRNPGKVPQTFSSPEANGWGGNVAPIVDDARAAEEDAAWKRALRPWDEMVARSQAVPKPTRWQRLRRRLHRSQQPYA